MWPWGSIWTCPAVRAKPECPKIYSEQCLPGCSRRIGFVVRENTQTKLFLCHGEPEWAVLRQLEVKLCLLHVLPTHLYLLLCARGFQFRHKSIGGIAHAIWSCASLGVLHRGCTNFIFTAHVSHFSTDFDTSKTL